MTDYRGVCKNYRYIPLLYHTYAKKSRLDNRTLMLYYRFKLIRFTGVPLSYLVECGDLH